MTLPPRSQCSRSWTWPGNWHLKHHHTPEHHHGTHGPGIHESHHPPSDVPAENLGKERLLQDGSWWVYYEGWKAERIMETHIMSWTPPNWSHQAALEAHLDRSGQGLCEITHLWGDQTMHMYGDFSKSSSVLFGVSLRIPFIFGDPIWIQTHHCYHLSHNPPRPMAIALSSTPRTDSEAKNHPDERTQNGTGRGASGGWAKPLGIPKRWKFWGLKAGKRSQQEDEVGLAWFKGVYNSSIYRQKEIGYSFGNTFFIVHKL